MIVLASASTTRQAMLRQAGVAFLSVTASIDEEAVKAAMREETNTPGRVAEVLAELKAVRVSSRHPGQLVIGADQMLDCEGMWFDKPTDRAGASLQLQALRGKTHRLSSAVVAVRDGQRLWHHTETASLTMRRFSDAFLEDYLDQAGEAVTTSVGAYAIEGLGAQLFILTQGDHFTILGLPLFPLLDFLREQGELKL